MRESVRIGIGVVGFIAVIIGALFPIGLPLTITAMTIGGVLMIGAEWVL